MEHSILLEIEKGYTFIHPWKRRIINPLVAHVRRHDEFPLLLGIGIYLGNRENEETMNSCFFISGMRE